MTGETRKESIGRKVGSSPRRKKFVHKDLQLKIIFATLFVAIVVFVVYAQIPIAGMWRATSSELDAEYSILIKLLLSSFGISLLLTIPLGVFFSFQFCGPIYKIKKFFLELNSGRWDKVCRLSKGDDLHDVKDVINQYVGLTRDRVRSQHEILKKVRDFLRTCASYDKVDSLLTLIDDEDAEYRRRLGTSEAKDDPGRTTTRQQYRTGAVSEGEATTSEKNHGRHEVVKLSRAREL